MIILLLMVYDHQQLYNGIYIYIFIYNSFFKNKLIFNIYLSNIGILIVSFFINKLISFNKFKLNKLFFYIA